MQRYTLLPHWYTTFYQAHTTGMPVMRPMFLEFPEDESTYSMDNQWMIGSSLLVCPVTAEGQNSVRVYLPNASVQSKTVGDKVVQEVVQYNHWFDLETLQAVPAATSPGGFTVVQAPLGKNTPVFIRPGSILSRKMRLRRSSKLMYFDPYTLVIAPTLSGTAEGTLYLDDEHTLAHDTASGAFAYRFFRYANGVLTCSAATPLVSTVPVQASSAVANPAAAEFTAPNTVERIVLGGQSRAAKKVTLTLAADGSCVELTSVFDDLKQTITIKKPDARVMDDWSVKLEF